MRLTGDRSPMIEETKIAHRLVVAEAPAKPDLLALIEELRVGVETGAIISLVAIPVHPNREWSTRSAGEVRMLELAGLLGRVWLDANEALKNV